MGRVRRLGIAFAPSAPEEPLPLPELPPKPDFWAVFEEYLSLSRSTLKPNSLKKIISLHNHLKKFASSSGYAPDFEDITFAFWEKFQLYFKRKKLHTNSVSRLLRTLKSFLTYALKHGHQLPPDYKEFSQKENRENDLPALSEEELNRLRALDLSAQPRLERIRDMFLFQCATSLRYVDFQALRGMDVVTSMYKGSEVTYLSLEQTKTGGKITGARLSPEALAIYRKYGVPDSPQHYIFPQISNQKYNSYLKEVALLAELDRMVKDEYGKATHLWTMVCTHTAHRTFITQAILWGWSIRQIQTYTGHKSLRELEGYIKRTSEHNLEITEGLF